jgi:hypothetical protein
MDSIKVKPRINKELICNVCGKRIVTEHGIFKEDVFEAAKEWGYFSKYDLEVHKFNMCEECYDAFIASFKVPIEVVKKKEVL